MKKLMMAAAVALAAIGLNAATVTWGATKGYLYDGAGDSAAKITSGSAYLMFVTSSYTQSDLVADFKAANYKADATLTAMGESGAMATGAGTIGSNARISGSSTYATTSDGSVYFVVFNNDKMYVSATADAIYDTVTGEATASFASISTSSKATIDIAGGYSGAGWYGDVPEPTSGLLMLIGMAGLALRRKRA